MNNNYGTTTLSYYDYIDDLPYDKHTKQSDVEVELLKTLFKKNETLITFLLKQSYEPFLVAILFIIFSLPYTENVIQSIFPMTTNLAVLLLVFKVLFIMLGYYVLKQTMF